MATGSTSSSSLRTTGMLVAAAFALIAAGVVIFIAFASRSGQQAPAVPSNVVDIGEAPEASGDGTIQKTGASHVQFSDKNDPTRLASELAYKSLDPVGQGYFKLDEPRAWIYMKDGKVLHIRADAGRVKMPSERSQPESGEFRGKVVLRIFPPPEERTSKEPLDPEKDLPLLLAVTESVNFDSVLMELQTADPVTVSTRQILFEGVGIKARFNQVRERIDLFETNGKFIRYNPMLRDESHKRASPAKRARDVSAESVAGTSGSTGQGGAADAPAANEPTLVTPQPPRETLYRALFSDNLTVKETTRTLAADTLEVFARTLDNKLPENAFGTWGKSGDSTPAAQRPKKNAPTEAQAAAPSASGTPGTASTDPFPPLFVSAKEHDIVLAWTGTLVVTPILTEAPPVELDKGNHFAARFSADKPGAQRTVVMTDTETGASGVCAHIEYAATTQTLALLSGPNAPRVALEAPGQGRMDVPNFKINLGSGASQVLGGGLLADAKAEATQEQTRRITWTDQADFVFRMENGRMKAALDSAAFQGKVLARDQVSMIAGDFLRAEFMPAGRQLTAMKSVHVEGNVVGVAGTRADVTSTRDLPPLDPYITADVLDAQFVQSKKDPNQTEPSFAVATGAVRAATRDAWMTADRVEATLGHDKKNSFTATDLVARSNVHFERADGVMARADELRADPLKRTADLSGKIVALSRGNSAIYGTQMHLADAEGAAEAGGATLVVHGPGSFEHVQSADASSSAVADANGTLPTPKDDPTRVTATWTRSLKFNNTSGLIEADGDTTVIAASALSTQTARSNKLRLFLTPEGETSPTTGTTSQFTTTPAPANGGGADLSLSEDRRLLRAEAIGWNADGGEGDNATVEVRRYGPPPAGASERVFEQMMFIQGSRIIADDVAGTITVPAAGLAVVRDQRTAPASTTADPTLATPASPMPGHSRGTSKFTWAESMQFTRGSGLLSMHKDVELIHVPLGSEQAIRLVAMQVDAWFSVPSGQGSGQADLIKAEANGAVYADYAHQKLLADRFIYDALNATAEAIAAPGNRVTFYDEKKGPTVAGKLFWDLKNDRIEVRELAPVTATP